MERTRTVNRLTVVLALNLVVIVALVSVGVSAHSLSVLAEGGDYLADAAAIGVSLLAILLSQRRPTAKHPHGFPRATKFAALVNGGWLLVLNLVVALSASWRLLVARAHPVNGLPVLIVSAVAAGLMLVGVFVLRTANEGADKDVNMRAVLLDTAADASAAAGVALTGATIFAMGGLYWLDPAVALLISAIVSYHALALLGDVIGALRTKGAADRPEE